MPQDKQSQAIEDEVSPRPEFAMYHDHSGTTIKKETTLNGETITNPIESARLLNKVRDKHSLIQISMPGVPEIFFSAILSINPDSEYILLDEINTKHGHELLLIHKKMHVVTKINGIEIRFSANLIDINNQHGSAVYKIAYPESIQYLQKRQNYRINIGLGIKIPIKLKREDGIPVYGHMINLSETGAGIELDSPCPVQKAEILPYCELRIHEDDIIKCQLEIRYINDNNSKHIQRIGGQFIGLDGTQQRILSKLVIELQRDLMKRLPKDAF